MPDDTQSLLSRFLSRFSYAKKFLIIGILFATSLAIALFFMVRAQAQAVEFAESELKGSIYIRSVRKLIEAIPEHAIIAHRLLNGDVSAKNDLTTLQGSIASDFKNLISIDNELHGELGTTADELQTREASHIRPSEIEKRWSDLIKRIPEDPLSLTQEQHQRVLADLMVLMSYVGESSRQITEREAAPYNLLVTVLSPLPWAALETGQAVNTVHKIQESGAETVQEEKNQLIEQLGLIKYHNGVIKSLLEEVNPPTEESPAQQNIVAKFKESYRHYLDTSDAFISAAKSFASADGPKVNATDVEALGSKALSASFSLWDNIYDQADHIIYERIDHLRFQQRLWLGITLLTALLGLLLGYAVLREITRPLDHLVGKAKLLASGDLSARSSVMNQDEVGQVSTAFNMIADSFQELIGRLQWTGIQLTTSTTEIAAAAKQQEATVVQQEATTKQIAVTAREISTTAKEFAKTMNEVSATAEQTSALASSGKAGLNRMELIMRQMVEASSNIASKLGVLSEKAGNITNVITTINKVAEQTNLLSLNAAIEAEKAGEHGRSFAVIAREIRRLADQTGNATLDIEKMVNEMVSAVSAGVMGVDKFSEEIHTGVGQVSVVSELLSKIIEQVQALTSSFENVNQGMQTQTLGAEQINESIMQLSDAAQQTTESIRQFNNAIEQLNNAALEMQTAVSKLKR